MKYTEECIIEFEKTLDQLTTELADTQAGSDQGLVPIYSLLSSFLENVPEETAIWQGIKNVITSLDEILETTQLLDNQAIQYLSDFTKWGESIVDTMEDEPTEEFLPLKHHYFQSISDVLDKIITEVEHLKVDSDTGMIPIYSIITEYIEQCDDPDHEIYKAMDTIRRMISNLLDMASPFDAPSIKILSDFTSWGLAVMSEIQENQPITPFKCALSSHKRMERQHTNTSVTEPETTAATSPEEEVEEKLVIAEDSDMEILQEFHTEALEHLEQIESSIMTLENDPTNEDGINAIFRSFHTIKGVAGFLSLHPIQKLAHHIESLLDLVRSKKLTLTSGMITLVLESKDALSALVDQITECIQNGTQPEEIIPILHLIKNAEKAAKGQEIQQTNNTTQKTENTAEPESSPAATPQEALQASPSTPAKPAPKVQSTIRVNTDKVDLLMNMVGELVIVQSQIQEGVKGIVNTQLDNVLQRNLNQLSRICKDLQNNSMALRMIPIKPTFQKMHRLARDLSNRFDKPLSFTLVGEETELDRNMVEQIGDPLIHMVRNAIDHGLEDPEVRQSNGKDIEGKVSLSAYYRDNFIVIELKDDGAGMDPEKLRAKAIEKGLIDPNEEYTEQECYQFIFLPGFSTAAVLSDVSGRGVGMDVVKRNITDLRGTVDIDSTLGQGTTFYIKLPLTTAIIDGLLVQTGDERFILPTSAVHLSFRPKKEQISIIKGDQEIINHRGKSIPVVRLHRVLNIATTVEKLEDGIVVLIENSGKPFALFIDSMINKQEVVIKNLGSLLQSLRGISGGAILGDGRVALILDPVEIARIHWQPTLAKVS